MLSKGLAREREREEKRCKIELNFQVGDGSEAKPEGKSADENLSWGEKVAFVSTPDRSGLSGIEIDIFLLHRKL